MFLLSNINLTERYVDKMSEQKYYVKLKSFTGQPKAIQLASFGFCGELVDFVTPKVSRGNYLLKKPCTQFTKSELAEIMDGALYTQTLSKDCMTPDHVYYGSGKEIVSEWINPLVELVLVEDDE